MLVIDDEDQEAFALALELHGVEAKHAYPDAIELEELGRADLVLIDEFIAEWPSREAVRDQPGLYVRDGLALSAVLRSEIERRGPSSDFEPFPSRTAIVLRTGHLNVLAAGTPQFMRPMSVAGRHDLEWVANKTATPKSFAAIGLAAASLPERWDPSSPSEQLEWLGLLDKSWQEEALIHIEQCRPPWSVLAATSAGRRWLAWFMQQILPFPTFLVDDLRAASYLGLKPSALDELLASDSVLSLPLRATVYNGQLAEFSGRRWWRAGLNDLRQQLLGTASGRMADDIAREVIAVHGSPLEELGLRHPVFQINVDYDVLPNPVEITDAVRLQPDGWPSYADDPWLETATADEEPDLKSLVVIDDRSDVMSGAGQ